MFLSFISELVILLERDFGGQCQIGGGAINDNCSNWSSIGHLVEDTRSVMQSSVNWKCVYIKRLANMAAHKLAKLAIFNIIDKLWDSRILECISNVI